MDKRLLNSILIVLMLAIWIVVLYRVFNFFKTDSAMNNVSNAITSGGNSFHNFAKDTFDLKHVDRDPFLDKFNKVKEKRIRKVISKPNEKSSVTKKNKIPPKKRIADNSKWPKLSYYGYIRGMNSSSELVLIKVNNKLHKIREGDDIEGVYIKRVYRDSIIVKMEKQTKVIVKN